MKQGIEREAFARKYGPDEESRVIKILEAFPGDLYSVGTDRICLTPKGMRVANRIWSELV
jgi:hypothetical protein